MAGHIRKRGQKWYYSFELSSVDGKRKRIERVGGRTKREAEAALRNALQEYQNAGLHFEPSEISIADYMDYWVENYVDINCKYNTKIAYEGVIKNQIKPALGMYKLKSLSPVILQEFINKKYISGISKNYLSGIVNVLKSSLKYAVYPGGFIKDNPMQYIMFPKFQHSSEKQYEIISHEDFKRIINRFPMGTTYYIPLMIGYYTGFRISEVSGLTWDDIDLKAGTIDVNKILIKRDKNWYFGTPKTKSSVRIIRIGKTLAEVLKTYKKYQLENRLKYGEYYYKQYEVEEINNNEKLRRIHSIQYFSTLPSSKELDMVCTYENGKLFTPDSFRYASRVINYELNIDFNFHALRHTHATTLIENGANIKDVQQRLGHAKIGTTLDTYSHVTEKMENQTVEIFEQIANLPTI